MNRSGGDERVYTTNARGEPDVESTGSGPVDCEAGPTETRARLDRLESLVETQQETIETVIERLASLEECRTGDSSTGTSSTIHRRTALKAGGLLALLGVGAGTASADPQGQVGTTDVPIQTVYTEGLAGPLTDETRLASLTGAGLTVSNGELAVANKASGGMIRSFRTEVSFPSTITTQVWARIPSDAQVPNPDLVVTHLTPDGSVTTVGEYSGLYADDEVNNVVLRTDDASSDADGFMPGEHTIQVRLTDGDDVLELEERAIDIDQT